MSVQLLAGDCRDLLPGACPTPAAIITDPPYGIEYSSGQARKLVWTGAAYGSRDDGSITGDDSAWAYAWLRTTYPNTPMAVFASARRPPPWPDYVAHLVWDKGDAAGMGDLSVPWKPNHDPIYVYGRGWTGPRTTSVLRGHVPSRVAMGRMHPHQKPMAVVLELIRKAPAGIILDPFAGSGTTLLAAELAGRDAIGCEIDPTYVTTAQARTPPALF